MARESDYVGTGIYDEFSPAPRPSPQGNQKRALVAMYERILSEMCMNRFVWTGIPKEVDTRYIEHRLFANALVVFYFDEEYGRFMCLAGTGAGEINMYNNPTKFIVYGNAMLNKTLSARDCVPVWANYNRIPDIDIVRVYARRLAEADRTLEVNMIGARHPFIAAVDSNERMSFAAAFKEIADGQPVIFGTESMAPGALGEKLNVFPTSLPSGALKENMEVKTRIWNEALTLLGIMNVNSEKRERMVVEEASGSSGQVLAMRSIALNARRVACEMINEKYGLNVAVNWALDENGTPGEAPMESTSLTDLNPMNGGEVNG